MPHLAELDPDDDAPLEEASASPSVPAKGVIDYRIAMALYALLAVAAVLTLKGNFLIFMLIVLGAIALKTFVHHLREKLDD